MQRPIYAQLVKSIDTAYSTYGGQVSQAGEWDLKVTIKRSNLYDLNYRATFTVNKSYDTMNQQHQVDKVETHNPSNQSSTFTPMVIGLSVIIIALLTYFCINALNRLHTIQRHLGLQNYT